MNYTDMSAHIVEENGKIFINGKEVITSSTTNKILSNEETKKVLEKNLCKNNLDKKIEKKVENSYLNFQ